MNFICNRLSQLAKPAVCCNSLVPWVLAGKATVTPLLPAGFLGTTAAMQRGLSTVVSPLLGSTAAIGCSLVGAGSVLLRRCMASLQQMHKSGPHFKVRPPRQPLGGRPMAKGIVLKTLIKKPKKPNSANRKCVLVRLTGGKEMVAYIPGIGHNLQEHNMVLVRVGRSQDLPGVKVKCVRGKYDLPHVIKK